jgi:hypothetical protein
MVSPRHTFNQSRTKIEQLSATQCVQFARGREGGFDQYAIKFFFKAADFELEASMYADCAIARMLPSLKIASDNASSSICHGDYVFPPYMVFERGTRLFACASYAVLYCAQVSSALWLSSARLKRLNARLEDERLCGLATFVEWWHQPGNSPII